MIRALRNSGIGQILLGAIVVAIILAFVLSGANPNGAGGDPDDCVAQAGEQCISPKEFDAAYRLLSSIGLNETAAKRLRLREVVARGLIERDLLIAEAAKVGIGTSEDDIDEELLEGRTRVSLPAENAEQLAMSLAMCVNGPIGCEPGTIGLRAINVKKDGKFDIDTYKQTVRVWTRRSPGHFKDMQRREYTAERLRQLIRSSVRVSEDEAFLAYSRVRSKATARTVSAKLEWFKRYTTSLSKDELSAFIESHKDALEQAIAAKEGEYKPGCSVVSEIRIDSADPGTEAADEAKKKAEKLLTELKIKRNFEAVARTQSQADSAALGGFVGCLDENYGAGSAELIEAAAALKKAGDLSGVVETIRGFTILQLVDRVSEENRKEVMLHAAARELAQAEQAEKNARTFASGLIEKAQAGTSLEDATQAQLLALLSLKEGDDSPALTDENVPRVEISRAVSIDQDVVDGAQAGEAPTIELFKMEKDGDTFKDPINTSEGFVVLQLKSKDMLTKESFAEDRDRIMATLRARKAEQALSEFVEELVERAGGVHFNTKFVPPAGAEDNSEDS